MAKVIYNQNMKILNLTQDLNNFSEKLISAEAKNKLLTDDLHLTTNNLEIALKDVSAQKKIVQR
jgi:hypothetical protein